MVETRTHRFRARRGAFGFAADLTGRVVERGEGSTRRGDLVIHSGISLALPAMSHLYWEDAAWLCFGASLHAPEMLSLRPGGLVIEVHALDYPLTDYRCEVAALVMSGFLREELRLRGAAPSVTFGPGGADPVFDWGGCPEPPVGRG